MQDAEKPTPPAWLKRLRYHKDGSEATWTWRTECPCHTSSSSDLEVYLDMGGKWVLLCEAGCAEADVRAALGLTWYDLNEADADTDWQRFSSIDRRMVEWVIPGLVPAGMLTVLAGLPGIGKSLLTCRWAAELSRMGAGTLLASAEDDPHRQTVKRLIALEADLDLVYHPPVLPVFTGEQRHEWLAEQTARHKPRLLVFDPFTAMIHMDSSSNSDQHMRRILAPLAKLAEEHDCAIVYVLHLNKGQASDPLARIGGSVAFGAAARSALLLALDQSDDTGTRRLLAHVKSNVSELAQTHVYQVVTIQLEDPPDVTARLQFTGLSDAKGADLLIAPLTAEERTDRESARAFLLEALTSGARPAREVEEWAHAQGVSQRTLERARRELDVRAFRQGKGWSLKLPDDVTKS